MTAGRSSSLVDRISRDPRWAGQDPNTLDWGSALKTVMGEDAAKLAKSQGRWKLADKFAWGAVAAPFAVAAAPAIAGAFTGGAAASAAPAATAGATAAGAGGMTLGNIFNLANLGVGAFSSWMGNRSSNRALDAQMRLQQQQFAAQQAADAEARAEAKRQFDIQQQNTARQIAADDNDRAYTRSLSEAREARLAPYRAQADIARRRLAAFLGIG